MSKRVPLDTNQFHVDLPPVRRDPLDTLIPQLPPVSNSNTEAKNVHSDVRTNERTTVQKPIRLIIRHAFDIYSDQLYGLQAIQLEAVQNGKKKPKLGTMVQKALDLYLQQKREK